MDLPGSGSSGRGTRPGLSSPELLFDAAARLADALASAGLDATLPSITGTAVRVPPQVDHASISVNHPNGRLETRGATADLVLDLDAYQRCSPSRSPPIGYAMEDRHLQAGAGHPHRE